MRRLAKGFLFMAFFPMPALAEGCFGTGVPLFHCSIGDTKQLDVCLQGNVAYYRFGPKSGPAELILSQAVEDIYLLPWNGVGSSIYEELEIWAGDVTYQVHYALARIAATNPELSGGVRVYRGDETLADLRCDAGTVSDRDFEPLYNAKTNAGQCWDRDAFLWGAC